jgi:hypothetical protein
MKLIADEMIKFMENTMKVSSRPYLQRTYYGAQHDDGAPSRRILGPSGNNSSDSSILELRFPHYYAV